MGQDIQTTTAISDAWEKSAKLFVEAADGVLRHTPAEHFAGAMALFCNVGAQSLKRFGF